MRLKRLGAALLALNLLFFCMASDAAAECGDISLSKYAASAEDSASGEDSTPIEDDSTFNENDSASTENDSPSNENGSTSSEDDSASTENDSPSTENDSPSNEDDSTSSENDSPSSEDDSTSNEDDSASTENGSPSNENDSPSSENDSASTENDSVSSENDSTFNENGSPSTENDSPSNEDDSASNENDSTSNEDDSPSNEDDSVSSEDDSASSEDDSVSTEDDSTSDEDDSASSENDSPSTEDDSPSSEGDSPSTEDEEAALWYQAFALLDEMEAYRQAHPEQSMEELMEHDDGFTALYDRLTELMSALDSYTDSDSYYSNYDTLMSRLEEISEQDYGSTTLEETEDWAGESAANPYDLTENLGLPSVESTPAISVTIGCAATSQSIQVNPYKMELPTGDDDVTTNTLYCDPVLITNNSEVPITLSATVSATTHTHTNSYGDAAGESDTEVGKVVLLDKSNSYLSESERGDRRAIFMFLQLKNLTNANKLYTVDWYEPVDFDPDDEEMALISEGNEHTATLSKIKVGYYAAFRIIGDASEAAYYGEWYEDDSVTVSIVFDVTPAEGASGAYCDVSFAVSLATSPTTPRTDLGIQFLVDGTDVTSGTSVPVTDDFIFEFKSGDELAWGSYCISWIEVTITDSSGNTTYKHTLSEDAFAANSVDVFFKIDKTHLPGDGSADIKVIVFKYYP